MGQVIVRAVAGNLATCVARLRIAWLPPGCFRYLSVQIGYFVLGPGGGAAACGGAGDACDLTLVGDVKRSAEHVPRECAEIDDSAAVPHGGMAGAVAGKRGVADDLPTIVDSGRRAVVAAEGAHAVRAPAGIDATAKRRFVSPRHHSLSTMGLAPGGPPRASN